MDHDKKIKIRALESDLEQAKEILADQKRQWEETRDNLTSYIDEVENRISEIKSEEEVVEEPQVESVAETEPEMVDVDITDAARELAEENEVDLGAIEGSGVGGRILVSDVRAVL